MISLVKGVVLYNDEVYTYVSLYVSVYGMHKRKCDNNKPFYGQFLSYA